ncbi:hypothetical protein Rumeso_03819 [Rubellimicrobium mesophilum DSM 19309]|uniref:Uncharacterized protein n=1 Tax=Rubellimicrobium mesophilum DSM 19309 TaxID=442562 RepID=A0A017HK53_9RHOB|nr:hypothetical protein [Rubellimicrobium mesophilum]EYD74523.1 hypothetical protein Rumeso_03819 [Rubellimicrobium mesophilum DSM 19309]
MTRSGVTHTDTASGKGHGQLTENPGAPSAKPGAKAPAPSSGQMHAQQDNRDHGSGKSQKGATPRG